MREQYDEISRATKILSTAPAARRTRLLKSTSNKNIKSQAIMILVYKINHIRQRHAMSLFEHGMAFLYALNENDLRGHRI